MAYKDITPPAGGKIIDHERQAHRSGKSQSCRSSAATAPARTSGRRACACSTRRCKKPTAANGKFPGSKFSPAKTVQEQIQQLAAGRHRRGVQGISRRHQRPAHHAGRRRHPLAQRRAAPDARPLRLPAPRAVFHRRALAREASGKSGHGRSSAKTPRTFTRALISRPAKKPRSRRLNF